MYEPQRERPTSMLVRIGGFGNCTFRWTAEALLISETDVDNFRPVTPPVADGWQVDGTTVLVEDGWIVATISGTRYRSPLEATLDGHPRWERQISEWVAA